MEKQNMNYAELDYKVNSLKKTRNDINEGQKKYLTDEEFEKILHEKMQTLTEDVNNKNITILLKAFNEEKGKTKGKNAYEFNIERAIKIYESIKY